MTRLAWPLALLILIICTACAASPTRTPAVGTTEAVLATTRAAQATTAHHLPPSHPQERDAGVTPALVEGASHAGSPRAAREHYHPRPSIPFDIATNLSSHLSIDR